jgi:RNA polymerase sigma factor (sigma-70 family)
MRAMSTSPTHRAIDAVWRIESARVIAGLARMLRDLDLAEELAQDALVIALETWPRDGVPDNPGAWLMTTAKRRAIDRLRRLQLLDRKHEELARELDDAHEERRERDQDALDHDIDDDLLRLVFVSCHPVLSMEARVALTLRLLCGLTTDEIARAFLTSEPTVAQRIVRAKRTLADADVAFEVPRGDALQERLASVLGVVYLVFNEGYSATSGDGWMRPALCEEALRLGRMLAALAPREPEAHGLIALMEIQASRLPCARRHRRCHRLEPHRDAVCGLGAGESLARGRTQPRGRGLDGHRSRECVAAGRPPARRAGDEAVPPAAQRARRSAVQAGPPRGGTCRVRARGGHDAQRARAGAAAGACAGVRGRLTRAASAYAAGPR